MAIQIITDSASDILPLEAEQLGIICLPLKVMFGDEEYSDSIDLTHEDFYRKLQEHAAHPTTSQVAPAAFADAFRQVIEKGDTAVVVTLSSKLSGTWQSAKIAAEGLEDRIFIVDSENVCAGERVLVLRGLELKEQGLSAAEIASCLEKEKKRVRLLALLDTLEYLKKGGRISAAAALVGSILSVKPVITSEEGLITMLAKARGTRQGHQLLREMVEKYGGIDWERPCFLAYTGLTDKPLQKFKADCAGLFQDQAVPVSTVGCAIGVHAGPGAVAIAFFEQEKNR